MKSYPMHKKLQKVREKSQAIGEFMEWLNQEKELSICDVDDKNDCFVPSRTSIEELLGEFFDIDPKKLEAEKVAMLEELRK